MTTLLNPKLVSVVLIAIYVLVRFVFGSIFHELGPNSSYVFEFAFVAIAFFYFRKELSFKWVSTKSLKIQYLLCLPLGAAAYQGAVFNEVIIPFDLENYMTFILILGLGPVLEEALFRQALWFPIEKLVKKPGLVTLLTAAIFSFSHFYAYFETDAMLHKFIIFQTFYTFLLGLWWGYAYQKTRSYVTILTLHFLFNLGFVLGSFI